MNPLVALKFVKDHWRLIAVALLVSALGVQSYWLQGAQGRIALYEQDEENRVESAKMQARQQDVTKRRADEDHAKRLKVLTSAVAGLRARLRDNARVAGDVVPAASGGSDGASGGGVICFARDRMAGGVAASLDRFEERLAALAERSARSIAGFETCAAWAIDNYHAGTGK